MSVWSIQYLQRLRTLRNSISALLCCQSKSIPESLLSQSFFVPSSQLTATRLDSPNQTKKKIPTLLRSHPIPSPPTPATVSTAVSSHVNLGHTSDLTSGPSLDPCFCRARTASPRSITCPLPVQNDLSKSDVVVPGMEFGTSRLRKFQISSESHKATSKVSSV